ncbi:ferritin family protein [Methanonatronarchaeum sp. AMET-Sl]|uniref:ferritin family protein n=1 Tax=Methanonatronarchaeum sp. AMET-Sl TaxID=3037654 RepID=UPI00244E0836|nr:ferritin family protein [Methanonatronarchaeum sp. AMET-Sl]WGI18046.1 ferritin family protein [Methanonatronarchaeum sp. AMET-Sl]
MTKQIDKQKLIHHILNETALTEEHNSIEKYKELKEITKTNQNQKLTERINKIIEDEEKHRKTLKSITSRKNLDIENKEMITTTKIMEALLEEIKAISLYKFVQQLTIDQETTKKTEELIRDEKKHARTLISILEEHNTNIEIKEKKNEIIINL